MPNVFRLRLGALLHFLIAIGHLICLFFLEEAFKAYGILDEMKHLCFEQEWLLYVVTVCLAVGFAIAGLYALSVAGDMRKLPLQRLVMIAIVGLYSIRVFHHVQMDGGEAARFLELLQAIISCKLFF